jgi:glutaredoxin
MENKTKGIISLILAIVLIAALVWLVVYSRSHTIPGNINLEDGTVLNATDCSKINNVTMIHSASCPHCLVAVPILREIEQELNMTYAYYDISIDKDKEFLVSEGMIPTHVPTAIINCKVYVGLRTKEEYKQAILG